MQTPLNEFASEVKLNQEEVKKLLETYEKYKPVIKAFLVQAKSREDEHLATELMFCLQTSQSPAKFARNTVNKLKALGKLMTASEDEIFAAMEGVRFSDKKSKYLFDARAKLPEIKSKLSLPKEELREWLFENIKGMGMKLASHYMRNIGIFGLAILDIHVQNFMARNGVLKGEVAKLNKKQYLENERIFLQMAKQIGIPPEELDIAIWMVGNGTGEFYG